MGVLDPKAIILHLLNRDPWKVLFEDMYMVGRTQLKQLDYVLSVSTR